MQEELHVEEDQKYNPETLARYYKYFKQQMIASVVFPLSFSKIPIKTCYNNFKKYFDKLSSVCKKYKIDPEKYIEFCVTEVGIREPDELTRMDNVVKYAHNLLILEQYKKIYEYYMKSAEYVADECIKRNITPAQFIKELIIDKKLAYAYMSGCLSKYYLATFSKLDKICEHLDQNSRDELSIILDVREKLNQDVQETFMKFKSHRVSPLKLSERLIEQKLK